MLWTIICASRLWRHLSSSRSSAWSDQAQRATWGDRTPPDQARVLARPVQVERGREAEAEDRPSARGTPRRRPGQGWPANGRPVPRVGLGHDLEPGHEQWTERPELPPAVDQHHPSLGQNGTLDHPGSGGLSMFDLLWWIAFVPK